MKIKVAPGEGFWASYIQIFADEDEARELGEWASHTFKHNFIILEFGSRIYAGGHVDNKTAWEEGSLLDETFSPTEEYELRCQADDAAFFILKYGEKK